MRITVIFAIIAAVLTACGTVDHVDPQFHHPAVEETRLWVDSDIAILPGQADPDDALAFNVLRGMRANIAGVSTTSGNANHDVVWETAKRRVPWAPLYRGGATCDASAVRAIAQTLRRERLRILALGPLTNIAALVRCYPYLVDRIERVTAVASRAPGEEFHLGGFSLRTSGLRDLNFEVDPGAFREVVNAGVFIRFVPFSAGNSIRFGWGHLSPYVDEELTEAVNAWANTLILAGGNQTLPAFDPVAAGAELWPDQYLCEPVDVIFAQNELITELAQGGEGDAERCSPENPATTKNAIAGALRANN